MKLGFSVAVLFAVTTAAFAQAQGNEDAQLTRGRQGILARTGCYLVDYSFTETDAIKPGYVRDNRVYDVNKDKSVKEWIFAEETSPTKIRIQHVLFSADLNGKVSESNMLKHTGEDWEYDAKYLYDFTGPQHWAIKDLSATPGLWTRKITNLDDGLRYQCAAAWNLSTAYPEWSCSNYAPIPGREYRDFGRKDYNTLERTTRVISYGTSWLEREDNIKTIHGADGTRTPLAKETGKIWYARLPDSECAAAQEFVKPQLASWELLRDTWDQVFTAAKPFVEKSIPGASRYMDIMDLLDEYQVKDLSNADVRKEAQDKLLKIIDSYRVQ